jgi:hypothetical protein
MEVKQQEVLETTTPATEVVELDVTMLSSVAGGVGSPSFN